MEKDRASVPPGVPPGIGPKLPDPPPLAPNRALTKREIMIIGIAGVLIVALATLFIIFMLSASRTPKQVVDSGAEGFPVQQEIVVVSIEGEAERYLDFYVSGDALACALLERSAGGFKVVDVAGGLALTSGGAQGIWMPFGLKSDKGYFIVGLVYDDEVTGVQVEGMPAVLLDNGIYRCWYYQGEGTMSINSESVAYIK